MRSARPTSWFDRPTKRSQGDGNAGGESFIIAKAGKPMVKVVPLDQPDAKASRRLGFMRGQISVPDDFDHMFEREIEEMFGPTE